jgi:hypothetical protein
MRFAGARAERPAVLLQIDYPIEGVEQEGSPVRVIGWAVAPDGVASVEVFVNRGELRSAEIRLPRGDVAAALGDWSARASGWQAMIGADELLAGENQLRVVLTGVDGSTVEGERNFHWCGPEDGYLPALSSGMPARDMDAAYLALLGRGPTDRERLAGEARGLLATVGEIARSDEHRELVDSNAHGLFLLSGSQVASERYPVGTISDDGVVIVGADGRMMIDAGSNDFAPQFRGAYRIGDDWLKQWERVIDRGRERAAAGGLPLAQLVIPEKLAAETATYPEPLAIEGPRPIEVLLAARPEVLYPVERFRGTKQPAFLATESHVSPVGGQILFESVMAELGCAPLTTAIEFRDYLYLGDLGSRFDPAVLEAGIGPDSATTIEIVDQNVGEMIAVGGHLGTYRISRNSAAPHKARVLVFGDSYAMLPPGGVPGGFGDLLSRAFEIVHYCWAPFCWDEKLVDDTKPDVIVQEICERMIQAVPVLDVDLVELAAATIARKTHAGFDELFPTHLEVGSERPTRLVRRR